MKPQANAGARPEGAASEEEAARAVRAMFDEIAPRYDLLNHVLSLNIDRLWWWRTARRFRVVLAAPRARVLDLCCGTGDMTMALLARRPAGSTPVLAADFSHGMLVRGAHKFARQASGSVHAKAAPARAAAIAIEADAMQLPLADASIDLLTTAFGFRNLRNYREALAEFLRVMAPGATLGILDFAEPGGLLGKLYAFYFRRVLPKIGTQLSGSAGPYAYLPASVGGFPTPPVLMESLRALGYVDVSWTAYSFGIAGLYIARKPG